ncbi:hypothetical protein PMAYCL1PPCAC_19707, partial [Pristionchus mayeri]
NNWMSNPDDHELLRSTWSDDFEVQFDIGSRIYMHLFDGPHGAAARSLFPWIAQYEAQGIDISEASEFKIQALRLIQTIEQSLELVDDVAKLEAYLYKMGRRHVLYMPRLDTIFWETFQVYIGSVHCDDAITWPSHRRRDEYRIAIKPELRGRALVVGLDLLVAS